MKQIRTPRMVGAERAARSAPGKMAGSMRAEATYRAMAEVVLRGRAGPWVRAAPIKDKVAPMPKAAAAVWRPKAAAAVWRPKAAAAVWQPKAAVAAWQPKAAAAAHRPQRVAWVRCAPARKHA